MAGKIISLITGGTKGIGWEIAQQLGSQYGHHVILAARSDAPEAVKKLQDKGISVEYLKLDMSEDASISAAKEFVEKKYNKLDVLINNAGIGKSPKQNATLRDHYVDVYSTNVAGIAVIIEAFAELLKKSPHPRIVNVSSARGSIHHTLLPTSPPQQSLPYSISKTALNMLTVIYAQKLLGFKVNAASPGHCATELNRFTGKKPASAGAKVVVALATLGDDGPTAGFFEIEGDATTIQVIPW